MGANPYHERKAICLAIDSSSTTGKTLRTCDDRNGKLLREALGEGFSPGKGTGKRNCTESSVIELPGALGTTAESPRSHWDYWAIQLPGLLIHTHLIPALLAGNTVVSSRANYSPTGEQQELLNQLDCRKEKIGSRRLTGAALSAHPGLDGVAFTGSQRGGRF